ncbi:MAG TPA: hypothetical protein VLC54_06680 [Anaeromyxobacter sp.]|nr:hypothetical protein [Anaeromyxobacter sp.]
MRREVEAGLIERRAEAKLPVGRQERGELAAFPTKGRECSKLQYVVGVRD